MNTKLLLSKKFRTAVLAAISGILTFSVTRGWLQLDPNDVITLISAVMSPFIIYIGAEGYSESQAKAAIEQGSSQMAIAEKISGKDTGEQ